MNSNINQVYMPSSIQQFVADYKDNKKIDDSTDQYKVKPPIMDDEYVESYKQHEPVQAIPAEDIEKIKEYFHRPSRYNANNLRNYCYFILSINIARRAGDVLNLKISDVIEPDGSIKDHVIIGHEQKTGKRATIKINQSVKEALCEYISTKKSYHMSDYLFQNYRTHDRLTVDGARWALKKMNKDLGLDLHIGTHSLRKTWATQTIKNNPHNSNVEIMVSKALNHSSVPTTYHYIGFTQNEMDDLFEKNAL